MCTQSHKHTRTHRSRRGVWLCVISGAEPISLSSDLPISRGRPSSSFKLEFKLRACYAFTTLSREFAHVFGDALSSSPSPSSYRHTHTHAHSHIHVHTHKHTLINFDESDCSCFPAPSPFPSPRTSPLPERDQARASSFMLAVLSHSFFCAYFYDAR